MKTLVCSLLVFSSLSAFGFGNTDIGSMQDLPNPYATSNSLDSSELSDLLAGLVVNAKGIAELRSCADLSCQRIGRVGYGENLIVLNVEGTFAKVLIEDSNNNLGFISINDISIRGPAPYKSVNIGKTKRYAPSDDYGNGPRFVFSQPSKTSKKLKIVFRGFFIIDNRNYGDNKIDGWVPVVYWADINSISPWARGWIEASTLGSPILE